MKRRAPAIWMGLREADQNFSKAIKHEVILTERGKPIAVIRPLPETDLVEAALQRMAAEGRLRLAEVPGPMRRRGWKPIRIKGRPLSQTLREDRDAR